MNYNIPPNSIEQVFTAIFLTKEGNDAYNQGLETNGIDEYYYESLVVINVSCLESYYQSPHLFNGKKIVNARTKSGDEWSIIATVAELLNLKKTQDFFTN